MLTLDDERIPFDRARSLANKEGIAGVLYPLFEDNIDAFYSPNQTSQPVVVECA